MNSIFTGYIDAGRYESIEVYFERIKHIFLEYASARDNLRNAGTDGYSEIYEINYASIIPHKNIGESFIAKTHSDMYPIIH